MLQTTNKMYAKKTQKYANNPQKYAKTRKSNQFAISALFILDMDITRQNFCFGGLTNQSFSCTIRAIQGANKRLILYSRLGTQMYMHVTMHQSLLPVWRYDKTWYDMFSPSSVASRHGVEKRSILVWNVQFWRGTVKTAQTYNSPNVRTLWIFWRSRTIDLMLQRLVSLSHQPTSWDANLDSFCSYTFLATLALRLWGTPVEWDRWWDKPSCNRCFWSRALRRNIKCTSRNPTWQWKIWKKNTI